MYRIYHFFLRVMKQSDFFFSSSFLVLFSSFPFPVYWINVPPKIHTHTLTSALTSLDQKTVCLEGSAFVLDKSFEGWVIANGIVVEKEQLIWVISGWWLLPLLHSLDLQTARVKHFTPFTAEMNRVEDSVVWNTAQAYIFLSVKRFQK